MERIIFFKNYIKYVKEIKSLLSNRLKNFKVYVFGSVVRGDYSIGLSDIDIAIVSDDFESREKKLEIYDLLFEKYFDTPFEFHLLTERAWKFYKRFIGDDEIIEV